MDRHAIQLALLRLNYFRKHKNRIAFSTIISLDWDGTGSWNPSSLKTRTCSPCIVNTMVADVLVTQEAKASAAMVLTYLAWNIHKWNGPLKVNFGKIWIKIYLSKSQFENTVYHKKGLFLLKSQRVYHYLHMMYIKMPIKHKRTQHIPPQSTPGQVKWPHDPVIFFS